MEKRQRRLEADTPEARADQRAVHSPPHRLRFLPSTAPYLFAPFTKVIPSKYWMQSGDREVQVSCPCGEVPNLHDWKPTLCDCGRAYLLASGVVRVGFSPMDTDPLPEPELEHGDAEPPT